MKTTAMLKAAVMEGVRNWVLRAFDVERQELRVLQGQISALAKLEGVSYEAILDAAIAAAVEAQTRKAA